MSKSASAVGQGSPTPNAPEGLKKPILGYFLAHNQAGAKPGGGGQFLPAHTLQSHSETPQGWSTSACARESSTQETVRVPVLAMGSCQGPGGGGDEQLWHQSDPFPDLSTHTAHRRSFPFTCSAAAPPPPPSEISVIVSATIPARRCPPYPAFTYNSSYYHKPQVMFRGGGHFIWYRHVFDGQSIQAALLEPKMAGKGCLCPWLPSANVSFSAVSFD